MTALNMVFSKLEKFTGNGTVSLNRWLKNFERCCVITDKKDDLVQGQILMLCVDGRAKACLNQFEDAKKEPQKYSTLKKQQQEVFDSPSDGEAKMSEFEQRIQDVNESKEEFMTSLLQTFCAANPSAKDGEIDCAVKRKFVQGIPASLRQNLFIFCQNPYDDKVTPQDLLKASRDAIVHLSTPTSTSDESPPPKVLAASPVCPPATPAPLADPTLDAIMMLSSKFDEQAKVTNIKLEAQQDQINALKSQLPHTPPAQQQYHQPIRQQHPRFKPNTRGQFPRSAAQFQSGGFQQQKALDANIQFHFCHDLNHFKRDCLTFKQQSNQTSSRKTSGARGRGSYRPSQSSSFEAKENSENQQPAPLLWLTGKLNGQPIDMLLDSGATICCLAKCCFTSSQNLRTLSVKPYCGPGIMGANGTLLKPYGLVNLPISVGNPTISYTVEFIIIEDLPYSCILGLSFLNLLQKWGIDNTNQTLFLNQSLVKVSHDPPHQDTLSLTTNQKFLIPPGQSVKISAIANGPALNSLPPVTHLPSLIDGHKPLEQRLKINILPTIQVLSHQHASAEVLVINNSPVSKTIGKGTKIANGTCAFEEITSKDNINLISPSSAQPPQDCVAALTSKMQNLSPPQFKQATQLLTEFRDVFSLSNSKIGRANVPPFDVQLEHSRPISTPLRRVPLHQQSIVKELLNHYQDLGLIELIDSSYLAATVLVEKKNVAHSAHITDRYRLVVDYRFINNALTDSGWPAPSLQQHIDSAPGYTFITSIDFNSGYHQIPCSAQCKPLLAFSPGYGFGRWTWTVMPQGIKPTSNHFQKTMEQSFSDLSDCILPPFFDDVVIKGTTFEDHLHNVRQVFTRIRDVGLTLNALKCSFFQTTLPYLGHVIDHGQIRLDPTRVQSIVDLPAPTTPRKLKEFLGMAQFCDRFLPHYSEIASPLHQLTEKEVPFNWTPECEKAFNTIKQLLMDAPLVRAPDSRDFFILETDTSDKSEGACLKAHSYADGKEYIVAYASRKFNTTETKWTIVEKEAHTIVFTTQKFCHYLFGKSFLLRTDNRVNTYIQSKRSTKSRKLLNWALELSEFDCEIENAIGDCLSRVHSVNPIIMDLQPEFSSEELT